MHCVYERTIFFTSHNTELCQANFDLCDGIQLGLRFNFISSSSGYGA